MVAGKRAGRFLAVVGLVVALAAPAQADNIAAAGDVSNPPGGPRGDRATARLLGGNGVGLVLALGDLQYECGELANFTDAYDTTWGAFFDITRPAPGNHEYQLGPACDPPGPTFRHRTPTEAPDADYYEYFAGRTPPHPGYYSFDFQGWHFVVLNTNCSTMTGGCAGAMLSWFKADLAAHRSTRCTVVYGHFPYHQSGMTRATDTELRYYWPTMVLENVDLYLAGHLHTYERLAPMRTAGNLDTDWGPGDGDDGHGGVPSVIVGTGGRSLLSYTPTHRYSVARRRQFGVLKIVPNYPSPGRWVQAFKGIDGSTHDRKTFACH